LNVHYRKIEKIVARRKLGRTSSDTGGRPMRIDSIGEDRISSTLIIARNERNPLTLSETNQLIENEVILSDQRRGESGLTSSVHHQTMGRIFKRIKATAENGQTMTNARHKEMKDIRNMVSMAVMNEAYAKFKAPQMIGNFDATQFIMSGSNEEMLVTVKKEQSNGDECLPLTTVEESKLSQAVKWVMLCNANGNLGDDVFLISDPNMNEEDFDCHSIIGLSHNTDPASVGWLCFSKSRAGNLKFLTWYQITIVVCFVNKCRLLLQGSLEDESITDRFYLVADGEDAQIKPLEFDHVASILEENKIDLGKGPASCTNTVGNACDRSNLFKGAKKVLKNITSTSKSDFEDNILESKIYAVISLFHPNIPSQKRHFISKGIVKVVKSLAKVVNFQIVTHGFNRIGVYPLCAKKCLSNCDPGVLKQFNANDVSDIITKIPALAELFLNESSGGQVTETQMDDAGIPTIVTDERRSATKDHRTQNQQRAVILSNPASRKRRKD